MPATNQSSIDINRKIQREQESVTESKDHTTQQCHAKQHC